MEYPTRRSELQWMNWLGGMALGALVMYVTDPSQGRRRRALLQDKFTSATHKTSHAMNQTLRDARHRLTGWQAEAMRIIAPRQAKPLDDHVLEARVRSRLGRALSSLSGLSVTAQDGVVSLAGTLNPEEEGRVLDIVEAIPGVEAVRYQEHAYPGRTRRWRSASPWLIAGAAGVGLLTWYGLTRRAPFGLLAAATGMGLLSRGRTSANKATSAASGEGVETEKTIHIQAPPDVVFDVWSRYENFPHFMSHVIEVKDLGQGRSHWIVQGPAGAELEWNAVLTVSDRPNRLAWQSEPGASVEHRGVVQLAPAGEGTRATVRLAWHPPAGVVGQGLAVLTGTDPAQALEEDLQRMREFIETGLPARDAGSASTGGALLH